MNYDITFCEGKGCRRKESCHRYCELMRFRDDKTPGRKSLISMLIQDNPNKSRMFWAEELSANTTQ